MMRTILALVVLVASVSVVAPAADPPTAADPRLAVGLALDHWDAQQKAESFLNSNRAHREAIVSLQQCRACHGGGALDQFVLSLQPNGPWIGVSVGPADGILRAQLRLPEGSGVVVTQVVPNGPAQQAGVEKDDVLLSVNGKPVGSGEDLDKVLQSATPGGAPLTLKLLHAGEAVEKQVAPAKADQQALIQSFLLPGRTVYRIGVLATEADATLRRQLRLGETGLVISEVQGDKPADKAGVKAGDVLVTVNRKQVAKEEELTGEILRSDGKPVELELVRGGARLKLTVTPAPEEERTPFTEAVIDPTGVHTFQSRELMLVYPEIGAEHKADWARLVRDPASTQPANPPVGERLRQITEQLDQLRQAVDALRNDVNEAQPPKQDGVK